MAAALAQLPHDAELYAMRGEALPPSRPVRRGAGRLRPVDRDRTEQRGRPTPSAATCTRKWATTNGRSPISVRRSSIDAQSAEAHRSLAWLLATCPDQRYRNPRQALASAEQAAKLAAPGDPFVLDALAAAHANAGQFDRAVRYQQEAIANVPGDFAEPFSAAVALSTTPTLSQWVEERGGPRTSAPLRSKPLRAQRASNSSTSCRGIGESLPISPTLPVILVRLTLRRADRWAMSLRPSPPRRVTRRDDASISPLSCIGWFETCVHSIAKLVPQFAEGRLPGAVGHHDD